MTWPLHTKPPRTWVRPLANLGFEVMHSSDFIGERRIGYRQKFEDANAAAQEHHDRSLALIAMVEEVEGSELDIFTPPPALWGTEMRPDKRKGPAVKRGLKVILLAGGDRLVGYLKPSPPASPMLHSIDRKGLLTWR